MESKIYYKSLDKFCQTQDKKNIFNKEDYKRKGGKLIYSIVVLK